MKRNVLRFGVIAALMLCTPHFAAAASCTVGAIGDDSTATGSTATTSLLGTEPSGTAMGAFLVSVLAVQGSGAHSATFTVPSGWTLVNTFPCNSGSSDINVAVATKMATSSDSPGTDMTWSWSTSLLGSEVTVAYGGVAMVDVVGTSTCAAPSNGTIVADAISPNASTDVTLGIFAANGGVGITLAGDDLGDISEEDNVAAGPALLVADNYPYTSEVEGPEDASTTDNHTTVGVLIGLAVSQ